MGAGAPTAPQRSPLEALALCADARGDVRLTGLDARSTQGERAGQDDDEQRADDQRPGEYAADHRRLPRARMRDEEDRPTRAQRQYRRRMTPARRSGSRPT